jgi:hypothetical protein
MLAEGGIAAAIGGEPVGQEMGPGCDIRAATFALRKAPSSAPVAAGRTAIRALPAKKPCWRFTACPCFPVLLFGAGTFSMAATTRLLSGLAALAAPAQPLPRHRRSGDDREDTG